MVAPVVASAIISSLGNLGGGLVDQYFNQKAADKSYKFQKKVLQNQVQWRVADAVKAGLHPLAALGINPASGPAGVTVGGLGAALSDMGQNIGRAAESFLTPVDKAAASAASVAAERAGLENDLLREQIASERVRRVQQGTPGVPNPNPPAMTTPGGRTAAQSYSDWYGDIAGEVGGIGNLVAESSGPLPKNTREALWLLDGPAYRTVMSAAPGFQDAIKAAINALSTEARRTYGRGGSR